MFLNTLFCSHLIIFKWLQNNLIPCPFKKLTGIDCPGCGFQRSLLALINGDFNKSLYLYPATIPLLAIIALNVLDRRFLFDKNRHIKKTLYVFTGTIIAGSYLFKLSKYIS
jgi:hypothetical protein